MPKHRFTVTGQRPAYGKEMNDLLQAFDLGIAGVFVPFSCTITGTPAAGHSITETRNKIRSVFESEGCIDVTVTKAVAP